jgi:hypothetical protein
MAKLHKTIFLFAIAAQTSSVGAADPLAVDPIAHFQDMTSVIPKCRQQTAQEIVVCGRREADKHRLPLITPPDAGDPHGETVAGERQRLQHITTPCQDRGPLLVGCGMVGVTAHVTLGGGGKPAFRKPAD